MGTGLNSNSLAHVYAGLRYMSVCICDIVLLHFITHYIQETTEMATK